MKKFKYIILVVVFSATLANQYLFISEIKVPGQATESRRNVAMPPSLSLITVALGPVRGLIVDALWWKVAELQESSEFFEILRITDWITVLQPHNSFVWTYHAWNLAYNISHEFPTGETRWKWIYSGIKLLRDEGLVLNPGNQLIKNELAWMFYDRLCGYTDPAQPFYLKEWSRIMGKYLPTGRREDIEHLINPSTDLDKSRAEEIEKKESLIPEKMLKIDMVYGPFQWKLPQAQAIYWGVQESYKSFHQGDLNYRATLTAALQMAFLNGALFEDKTNGLFITTNNLDITDSIVKDFKKLIKESNNQNYEKSLFNNFIFNAAPILYGLGKQKMALKLFQEFQIMHPENKVTFDVFISANLAKMTKKPRARYTQSLVEISLLSGYIYLAQGDFKNAAKFAEKAKEKWNKHQKRYSGNKVRLLQSFDNLKIVAFMKLLQQFPRAQQDQLLDLVHNKKSADLKIDNKVSFGAYLK